MGAGSVGDVGAGSVGEVGAGSVGEVGAGSVQIPPNCDLTLGLVCVDKSEPGRSVWRVEAHERFANPLGVIQGGFVAAYLDSAMGAAAVTHAQRRLPHAASLHVSNAEMKVSFFRPVQIGATLTCHAEVVSGGRRVAFLEATLEAEDGIIMAKATSTYVFSERRGSVPPGSERRGSVPPGSVPHGGPSSR